MIKKLKIKLVEPTKNKLQLVKLIKDCSGLGLRESKDLCDNLHNYPHITQEMPLRESNTTDIDYLSKFKLGLQDLDGKFSINGGVQWERNLKMLKLGLGDKSDYVDFIKDYIINRFNNSEEMLIFVLDKVKKEDLQEIFSNTEIEL